MTAPQLTATDAWLLAALTERSGRAVRLRDVIHDYDWLERETPTYDELSYGLPRLVAGGFAEVSQRPDGQLRFRATTRAMDVRRSVPGHPIPRIAEVLGAGRTGQVEDRSLGRLRFLTPVDLEAATRAHADWVERWGAPFVALASLITRWQNRRGPRDIR